IISGGSNTSPRPPVKPTASPTTGGSTWSTRTRCRQGRCYHSCKSRLGCQSGSFDMVRTATSADLKKPLGEVFSDLESTSESLLFRDKGVAVAALLTGSEFELYRELIRNRAWASVEEAR